MRADAPFSPQFLAATEQQVMEMLFCLDTYPYTDVQLFMYLTWVMSGEADTPADFVMRNMHYVGMGNARANSGI